MIHNLVNNTKVSCLFFPSGQESTYSSSIITDAQKQLSYTILYSGCTHGHMIGGHVVSM